MYLAVNVFGIKANGAFYVGMNKWEILANTLTSVQRLLNQDAFWPTREAAQYVIDHNPERFLGLSPVVVEVNISLDERT